MTHTDEELLALADRLDGIEIYSVREHISGLGTRPIQAANNAICEAAAALRAIVAERQGRTRIGGEASVAVCPICDIAGCHHIRDAERQATSDKALDDAVATSARLDDLENNLWNLCNAIDDEDWIGQPEGLTAKVVGHFEKHHRMHVEMLERAARQVAAIRDEPMAVNAAMCAEDRAKQFNEAVALTLFRQAIRDKALDEAAQAASNRAAYWWDEATAADDTGLRKLSLSYEAKALACTELAAAIRVMKGKPE